MNAAERGIDDQHELAAHPIRIGEPQRVVGAKIIDRAIRCARNDQTPTCLLERFTTGSSERQVIEMSALKHRRVAVRLLTARNFDRMQPRLRADAQHRVLHARHALLEDDFEAEGVSVESDESLQIARHDGDVIETGDCLHGAIVRRSAGAAQLL